MRSPEKEKQRPYYDALLNAAHDFGVTAADYTAITNREPRIGMPSCGVLAALGQPARHSKHVSAGGERLQMVYERRYKYVYLENDRVSSWQQ